MRILQKTRQILLPNISRCAYFYAMLILLVYPETLFAAFAQAEKVLDGDSLIVTTSKEKLEIRLWGIDSPEMSQPFGQEAKAHLESIVAGRRLDIEKMATDRYGRTVAKVHVGSVTANQEMIHRGAAWVYDRYCTSAICDDWRKLEDDAHRARRGLWEYRKSEAPWRWRKGQ